MDSKHISSITEASLEGLLNNCSQPNVSHATNNSYFTEKNFEDFVNKINVENYLPNHDESSDSEYSASIACMYIDSKNEKQQNVKCELAFTSYEKHVNVSESNSQEFTNTKLVDVKIVSMQKSFPSTVLPIMKILSPKSGPHICLECCFKCNKVFRVLDNPSHIIRIQSINKKNEFFKIEPSLCDDSCLCDLCWKDLEKTYKSIKSNNRKEETYSEKKYRLLERYAKKNVSKNQNQARRCSIHLCSRPYCQKMTVNECENIKKLFLTVESFHLIFVQSTKQTKDFLKFPFRLCKIHSDMILVMSTCQICGDKLNAPFNTEDWLMYKIWNFVLIENHLPLILKPAMFMCVTCKRHISKTSPGFPTFDLPRLREYILKSNAIRLKLYGESQYNLFNICQESTYLESPIVFPNTKEEKEFVRLTKVKFSDPLITTIYNYEIGCSKNYIKSVTSTALKNKAEQNLCTPKLELKHEGLDTNNIMSSFIAAVEPSDAIVNPVSIKRKQSNVICDTISNKDVKKQRKNKKYSFYEKNSTDDNNTKFYKNKNIAHSNSKIFSETNSEEILPDCGKEETDYIILDSYDDLSLDSHSELIKSKFEIKPAYEIEMDKNDTKSITGSALLNVAKQNRCTPKLELKDGLDTIKLEEEYFKTYDNSLQNLCQVDNVEIVENESRIFGSRQVVCEHNEIENNQSELNSHGTCEQKATLYNCGGDPKDSINSSKSLIHPSSHINRYSKRLSSDNIEPLIIKDIKTTSSSPNQKNSIDSPKKNVVSIPYLPDDNKTFICMTLQYPTKFNIQFPVGIVKRK
ncbi:uncharacterized protein LOC132935215 [Metopolophium dirhodum]|uniref:uncharacterized protein LOC132935215 n=1 Tax=Metopolophium dirhodum TaxID=44670 RepID=UPI00298FB5AB|nr:uncharacterized protein LOC132935215 [Metopolophium dirhodum]